MHTVKWKNETRTVMPHEEALGILLKEPNLFAEYRTQLKPDMFYQHSQIFKVMQELDNENILSFKNIAFKLRNDIETLHILRNQVISTQMLSELITTMKKNHLKETMNFIIHKALISESDPDEVFQELREGIDGLNQSETQLPDPDQDFDRWYEHFMEIVEDPSKAFGLLTGIKEIDNITTGFHIHDLIVVGARTSIGKSAFMIELLLRLTQRGYKCALFSLEMTKSQIYYRMMANLLCHPLESFRRGDFPAHRMSELRAQKELIRNIIVDDSRGISSEYIADSMRQIKRNQGLDFVVVDYLQDIKEKGEHNDNGGSVLARVCRKLRKAAKDSDCAVMALSQVIRDVEKRPDKRPQASDLSGSTGIETSADVIAMLYREDYYNEECETKMKNMMEVNFVKQRNGKLGKVELFYDRTRQKLVSINQRYDR